MAVLNPEFDAPNKVLGVPGWASQTGGYILVATLSNPTTPVTVELNGVTYTSGTDFTLTDPDPAAGAFVWTGRLVPSGLEPFTAYPFTVTQGAESNTGTFTTAMRKTDDGRLYFGSCAQSVSTPLSWRCDGFWDTVYAHAQAGVKIAGVFWVDDFTYAAVKTFDDTANSGLATSGAPQTTGLAADYIKAWMVSFGMLGPEVLTWSMVQADADLYPFALSRGTYRNWGLRNVNWYIQEGDWPYFDNAGFSNPVVGSVPPYPNARWNEAALTNPGPGFIGLSAFVGKMMPPLAKDSTLITPADTKAIHWVCEMGPVTLATMDNTTRGDGEVNKGDGVAGVTYATQYAGNEVVGSLITVTTNYGANQIVDTLKLIQHYDNPFTLLGMADTFRYPLSSYAALTLGRSGGHQSLYDHCIAEYRRLMTQSGQNPPSLMDSATTNGAKGSLVTLIGDLHWIHTYKYFKDAYTGNVKERFMSICTGTWDGSNNAWVTDPNGFTADTAEEGDVLADIRLDHMGNTKGFAGNSTDNQDFWGCWIDITGSTYPKELNITLADHDGEWVYKARFVQFAGNYPVSESYRFPSARAVDGGDGL